MMWSDAQIKDAWMHLRKNWGEVRRSAKCVCIQCGHRFVPSDIDEWLNKKPIGHKSESQPASDDSEPCCPNCRMDYVLGDASGYPVESEDFFKAMRGNA